MAHNGEEKEEENTTEKEENSSFLTYLCYLTLELLDSLGLV